MTQLCVSGAGVIIVPMADACVLLAGIILLAVYAAWARFLRDCN